MKTSMKKKSIRWLALGLILFLMGAVFASMMQTQFGNVSVSHVNFKNKDGYVMSAYLYKPNSATAEEKAPAIVSVHGNNGYTSALASYNIELSRRGYVVLALEMEGHGRSEYVPDALGDGSYGGVAAAEYLMTLDFVDANQLGSTGHSKGSNAGTGMARAYPENVKAILLNGFISPPVTNGDLDGAVTHTNVGLIMSRYDECSQDLLHHIIGTDFNFDYLRPEHAANLFGEMWGGENVAQYLNEGMGDWEEGTKRIFYTVEDCTHVTTVNSKIALKYGLDFFNNSMPAPNWIDSENQVWQLRFVGGVVQTIGFVMMFLALGSILLEAPFFAVLTAERSAPKGKLTGKRGPAYRAFFIVLLTIIPVLTFVHTYVYGENCIKQSAMFPFNPSAFGYLLWTVANAGLNLLVLVVWHFCYGAKHGGNLEVYGLSFEKGKAKEAFAYVVRAVAYAVVLVVTMFAALSIVEKSLLVEMATPISNIRTFSLDRIVYLFQYFVPFFLSFLIGNITFSAILREDDQESDVVTGKNMVKNQVIGVLQGAGGLTIMYIIWNIVYFVAMKPLFLYRETPYVMGNSGFMSICFSLMPMFGINSILSTHFSVKTRRVLVGALVCALFIVWVTFAGQSLALPSTQSAVGPLAG